MPRWHRGEVRKVSNLRTCGVCGGRRSRYNTQEVCASCVRDIATAPAAPAWLWDSEPLRQALADVDLGKALTIIRTAIGFTQLELASLVSWSQSTVQRAEAGTRDTLYDIRCLLDVAEALSMPRHALVPLIMGDTAGHREEEVPSDVNLSRRELGGVLAGLAATTAGLDALRVPRAVDAAHVRYLRASADKLYAKDQQVGGGTLARDGIRQYQRARRMLDEADYSDATGRDLMDAAGDLAVCVGWLSYDNGDHESSRVLYAEALLLAEQSGNDGLAVRALEKMTLQSADAARSTGQTGRAREAARLSNRAGDLARRDPSTHLHALLAAREAIAYAACGDARSSEAAISRAWKLVEHGLDGDPPGWLRFVNPSEIAVTEAKARLHLVLPTLEHEVVSPRTIRALRPLRTALADVSHAAEFNARFDRVVTGSGGAAERAVL